MRLYDGFIGFFVWLGWSPVAIFYVVFFGAVLLGAALAAGLSALVRWAFECAHSKKSE